MNSLFCGTFRFGDLLARWGAEEIYLKCGSWDMIYDVQLLMVVLPVVIGGASLLSCLAAWIFMSRRAET